MIMVDRLMIRIVFIVKQCRDSFFGISIHFKRHRRAFLIPAAVGHAAHLRDVFFHGFRHIRQRCRVLSQSAAGQNVSDADALAVLVPRALALIRRCRAAP